MGWLQKELEIEIEEAKKHITGTEFEYCEITGYIKALEYVLNKIKNYDI